MNTPQRKHPPMQSLLSLLLVLSLLGTQELTLHVHHLDHGLDAHPPVDNYTHLSHPHLARDAALGHAGNELIAQYDVSADGLCKTLTQIVWFAACLSLFLLLPFGGTTSRPVYRTERPFQLRRLYVHAPPLRAPPGN